MKYSLEARFEFARRLSATFQRSASNRSIPIRWSAAIPSQSPRTLKCYFNVRRRVALCHLFGPPKTPRLRLSKRGTPSVSDGLTLPQVVACEDGPARSAYESSPAAANQTANHTRLVGIGEVGGAGVVSKSDLPYCDRPSPRLRPHCVPVEPPLRPAGELHRRCCEALPIGR